MSDFMSYKGYTTSMVYDTEDKIIVGRVQDVDDIISFQGESVAEFESNFHLAIDDYLAAAEELGSAPEKPKPSPIMNVMTVDGYHARIEFDPELDMFRGEILGLNGGADFYGKNPKELRAEFKRSLAVFLEVSAEKKLEPRRHFSGKFNLRI
jgi:predicted HicB family RNase H-like nuclease